jgi:hypothetical protein
MSFFRIPSPIPQEGGVEHAKKGRTHAKKTTTSTQLFTLEKF